MEFNKSGGKLVEGLPRRKKSFTLINLVSFGRLGASREKMNTPHPFGGGGGGINDVAWHHAI